MLMIKSHKHTPLQEQVAFIWLKLLINNKFVQLRVRLTLTWKSRMSKPQRKK